jgi:uncharacterized membrane protein YraQ (UPF0718 family)
VIDVLRREAVYLWYYFSIQFDQIFRFWALGILLGSAISVFGREKIHQLFGALQKKRMGAFGVVPASIIGIASPLCMYGTIPISASFSEKGIRDDWLAAFMMSSILLNPQLIIYSAALGRTALVVRIVSCFFCGIAAGLCIRFFYAGKDRSFFDFKSFGERADRDIDPNIIMRLLKNMGRNAKTTGPYFLAGIALSAAFQRYIPESWIITLFGGNKAFGLLMAATIGVPLYACGGGTIPLLQWWLADGMSMGAACAFMITGPATKITNLGAVKIVLGLKHFALYILFSMVFAFASGLLVNIILGF